MPQIEVAFDIDANGIVNVSAEDKAILDLTVRNGEAAQRRLVEANLRCADEFGMDQVVPMCYGRQENWSEPRRNEAPCSNTIRKKF